MRIIACLAASMDGKIAPSSTGPYVRLGTNEDIRRLKALRDAVDAVLFGGSTFRAHPKVHRGLSRDKIPLHCILTQGLSLPPDAPLFHQIRAVPVRVYAPHVPDAETRARYPEAIVWRETGTGSTQERVARILADLAAEGVQSLLVEGGGEILSLFLEAKAIEELYLTYCPLLIGGREAPGLVSGEGFPVENAPRSEIIALEQIGNEIFLRLRLIYPL